MVKLYDIYGYIDYSNCYVFDEIYNWNGQILLNEEGWFEGVVSYSNENTVKKNVCDNLFVYGIFIPGCGIKIIERIPYISGSVLRGISIGTYLFDNNEYKGIRTVGSNISQRNYGVTKLVFKMVRNISKQQNIDVEFRDVASEISKLKKKLIIVRRENTYKDLYLSMYNKRFEQKVKLTELKKKDFESILLDKEHSPVRLSKGRKLC